MDNFMLDRGFLEEVNKFRVKTYYASILLLDFVNERPISYLQGRIVGGNMSIAGKSPTRRTGSLQIVFDKTTLDLTNIDNLISINKKFALSIGVQNPFYDQGLWRDYPRILDFPQGIFLVTGANSSVSTTSRTINLQFIDKMGMLNGVCGGTIPASVSLHDRILIDPDDNTTTLYPRINQIIQEVVQHFGGEHPSKIIIRDVPNFGRQVCTWAGSTPAYFSTINAQGNMTNGSFIVGESRAGFENQKVLGDDIGYMSTELTYPGELVMKGGTTVTGVLDEIVKTLGNFEYFYDVEGYFHFQKVQNFDKTGQAPLFPANLKSNTAFNISPDLDASFHQQYLPKFQSDQFLNEFTNSELVSQVSLNPAYSNIKNDFVVWGSRKANKDEERLVRYHLAIDSRPKPVPDYPTYSSTVTYTVGAVVMASNGTFWKARQAGLLVNPLNTNQTHWTSFSMDVSNIVLCRQWFYVVRNKETKVIKHYFHVNHSNSPSINESGMDPLTDEIILHSPSLTTLPSGAPTFDWREELYRRALKAYNQSDRGSYYDEELMAEWRLIFNPNVRETALDGSFNMYSDNFKREWNEYFGANPPAWNGYNVDVIRKPQNIRYWLDLIDSNSGVGQYSVDRIGRRSVIKENNKINEVLNREVPAIVFIDGTRPEAEISEAEKEFQDIGQVYCIVRQDYLPYFKLRNSFGTCYEEVRDLFHLHLMYNAQVSLTSIPILYLDVNKVVRLNFPELGVVGNYVINTISWNFGNMSTMQLQLSEAVVIV